MAASANVSLDDVRAVLIDVISDALQMTPAELPTDRPLQDYGTDSVIALSVFAALEYRFDCVDLPSTAVADYQTIDVLAPAVWDMIRSGHHDNPPTPTEH